MDKNKLFDSVSGDQQFVLQSGRVLKNIFELQNALTSMDDSIYHHHVTSDRNDFANWIEHVFEAPVLADRIRQSANKEEMIERIAKASEPKKQKKATIKAIAEAVKPKAKPKAKPKPAPTPQEKKQTAKPSIKKSVALVKKKIKTISKPKDDVAEEVKEVVAAVKSSDKDHKELSKQLDDVLEKEKEIAFREQKILEVEQRIEKQLHAAKKEQVQEFFSKDFVQGLVSGFLLTLIGTLIYFKFFFIV